MSSLKLKAIPLPDSDSDREEDELVEKRIKLIRELSELEEPKGRFTGGIVVSSEVKDEDQSASASLSAAEKKGLKEVEELERELDLKNTFSKETNRRDEDAEMNKYIDEQIRLRRERENAIKESRRLQENKTTDPVESELAEMFTLPSEASDKIDDILLHSLSKHLASKSDEKSEAMLSSQMLNGIPEVDLGISERIRTIEATEEAKLRMASAGSSRHSSKTTSAVPVNFSSNFKQHRCYRDARDGELKTSAPSRQNSSRNETKTVTEPVVVVGEEPDEIEYRLPSHGGERPPAKGKASDDYYLSKFKKNNRK